MKEFFPQFQTLQTNIKAIKTQVPESTLLRCPNGIYEKFSFCMPITGTESELCARFFLCRYCTKNELNKKTFVLLLDTDKFTFTTNLNKTFFIERIFYVISASVLLYDFSVVPENEED